MPWHPVGDIQVTSDDIVKVVKLLKLTQSDNEHEALAALRRANAILKKHDIQWDKFFASAVRGTYASPAPSQQPQHHGAQGNWGGVWQGQGFGTTQRYNTSFEDWMKQQQATAEEYQRRAQSYTPEEAQANEERKKREQQAQQQQEPFNPNSSLMWAFRGKLKKWFEEVPWWRFLRVKIR